MHWWKQDTETEQNFVLEGLNIRKVCCNSVRWAALSGTIWINLICIEQGDIYVHNLDDTYHKMNTNGLSAEQIICSEKKIFLISNSKLLQIEFTSREDCV